MTILVILLFYYFSFTQLLIKNKIIENYSALSFSLMLKFSRCSLGDTTANDACYEKALEVSNNRSARAKVCLCIYSCLYMFVFVFYIFTLSYYENFKFTFSFLIDLFFSDRQRSLARSAYNRGDYETSKILWCVMCPYTQSISLLLSLSLSLMHI